METQAAFIGADGAVHFDAEAAVDLNVALVIHPGHPEHDDPFRFYNSFHDLGLSVLGNAFENGFNGLRNLGYGLMKFGLIGVPGFYELNDVGHGSFLLIGL